MSRAKLVFVALLVFSVAYSLADEYSAARKAVRDAISADSCLSAVFSFSKQRAQKLIAAKENCKKGFKELDKLPDGEIPLHCRSSKTTFIEGPKCKFFGRKVSRSCGIVTGVQRQYPGPFSKRGVRKVKETVSLKSCASKMKKEP